MDKEPPGMKVIMFPISFLIVQFPRQRTRRVILKDLLLVMEQEKELCNSKLLYKALMK